MSSGKGIFKNLSLLLGGKTVAAIVSTVYIVIVTRALGPAGFGVLVTINGWAVTVGGIVAFSGWHGIVRYGAQALAAGDTPRLVRLARFTALVELGCGVLAMTIAFAFAGVVGERLHWPPDVIPVARCFALVIVANMLTTPLGILQLAGRFDRLAVHPGLSPALRLAGVLFVWLSGGGLKDYLIVWLISGASEGLFMWWLAWPLFQEMRGSQPMAGPVAGVTKENPGLIRFLATANADLTLRDFAPKAVPLVVGAVLGPAAAGIYSLANRAAVVIQQPANQLSQASYPVIAKLLASGDVAAAKRLSWKTASYAMAAAIPIVILLAFFSKQILELMGGKGFGAGALVFVLLAIGRAALLGAVPLSSLLIALGRTTASILVNVGVNLLTLPLLVLALTTMGLPGSGWYGAVTGVATFLILAAVLALGKGRVGRLEPEAEIAAAVAPAGLDNG